MDFTALPKFEKDLKKLQKRFRSLPEDLERLKSVLGDQQNRASHSVPIPSLKLKISVYKSRLSCKSLKNTKDKWNFRVVYAYFENENKIEFIEIYFKGDKENEDRKRLKQHYK